MFLAFGLVCAMLEAVRSGKGQVVDAAMVDGSAALMAQFFTMLRLGQFSEARGTNLLDTGAHFYDAYETKDSKWISIGSIEPQFYAELIAKAGLDKQHFTPQNDTAKWPGFKDELISLFKTKTRDEWCALLEGSDACFAPVLSIVEAPNHPHNQARKTFVTIDGVVQPAPAPRFSRTKPEIPKAGPRPGQDTISILSDYEFSPAEIEDLQSKGIVAVAK